MTVLTPGSVTVLTWGGEVSAVSQDAIEDSRWARAATVIDDWDEEFDRGKVRVRLLLAWQGAHMALLKAGQGGRDPLGQFEVAVTL